MVVMLMAMMVGSMVILLIVPTKKRERKHDVEELGSNAEQVVVRGVGSTDRPIVDSSHIVLSPTTYFPIHPPHPSLPPPKPSAYHNLTLKQTNLLGVPISGFVFGCNWYYAQDSKLAKTAKFLNISLGWPGCQEENRMITLLKIVMTTIGDKIMCTGSLLWKFMLYSKWPWRW